MASAVNRDLAIERLDGDEELYREIVGVYLEDSPVQVGKLEEALKNGDAATAMRLAHSLKSASGNVGAEALRDIAYRMEMGAKNGGCKDAAGLLPEFKEEFVKVVAELNGIASTG